MPEYEIHKPDLDSIQRINADIFFIKREHELAKKIEEVKESKLDLLWLAYGLILKYGNELDKLIPFMKAKAMPGWLIFAIGGIAKLLAWQAKRLKQ
jgi:hypothetical protein